MGSVVMPVWAVTIVAGVIVGLIALVWRDLIKRIDGISSKLDGHVTQDTSAHERITVLETKVTINTATIQENYNKFHRFQVEMRERADKRGEWLTEKFAEMYRWINEKVIDALRKP